MPTAPTSADQLPSSEPWIMGSAPGPETLLNGRRYLYFAGTGYLGLQGHPALITAARDAVEHYGVHTATSRSGFGTSPPVREVETRAAQFLGVEDALYLVSGYAGNFAIAAALSTEVDIALIDESAHDSLRESTRWLDNLQQPVLAFRHRDGGHVRELLRKHARPKAQPLLLTDGLFPMSGNLAPLSDYLEILGPYAGAMLQVDDAHGLATLGELGRGSLELAGVAAQRINRDWEESREAGPRVFHSATLSKAVGGHGGVVAGTGAFLDRVRRASGWYRAASAPAAPVAAATAKGLELVQAGPEMRKLLAANAAMARAALGALGLPVEQTPSPILGISWPDAAGMQRVQRQLVAEGIIIAYSRDYAGAGPDGMLRIAIFATHTAPMIERLVEALGRAAPAEFLR